MKAKFHRILAWMVPFVILALLLAALGYGYVHITVNKATQALKEKYEQDISTLIQKQLLHGQPVSITIRESQLGNPVFTDEHDIETFLDLFERLEWTWDGYMEAAPGETPKAGPIVEVELDLGYEISAITLPSMVINGRIYDGFIDGENALSVLTLAVNDIKN